VRHRGEVGELGFGGAADPDAEEALVEVELNQVVRPSLSGLTTLCV